MVPRYFLRYFNSFFRLYQRCQLQVTVKPFATAVRIHNCVSDNMTDNSCYFPCRNFTIKLLILLAELIATKIIRFQIEINVTLTLQICKTWDAESDSYYGKSVPLQARGAQRVPGS